MKEHDLGDTVRVNSQFGITGRVLKVWRDFDGRVTAYVLLVMEADSHSPFKVGTKQEFNVGKVYA